MKVPGFAIQGDPVFTHKGYSVIVGQVCDVHDMPHYLVVNTSTLVVELSSPRFTEARIFCACLGEELETQDKAIRSETFFAEVEHNMSKKNESKKSWN